MSVQRNPDVMYVRKWVIYLKIVPKGEQLKEERNNLCLIASSPIYANPLAAGHLGSA